MYRANQPGLDRGSAKGRMRSRKHENHREPSSEIMVGDQPLHIENASGASLLQLQYAAEHCHEEGQQSSSLVLNKGIELQHLLHTWLETIVLGMFTDSLRAKTEKCDVSRSTSILETFRNTHA